MLSEFLDLRNCRLKCISLAPIFRQGSSYILRILIGGKQNDVLQYTSIRYLDNCILHCWVAGNR